MSFAVWTRHEWRHMRLLRRVGALLCFAVPFVLIAGAEASMRGWLPGARLRAYDLRTVLYDAAPAVLATVWALVTALAAGQAYAGGHARGTEWTVLATAVPRTTVWSARASAVLGSAVVVVALSIAYLATVGAAVAGGIEPSRVGLWAAAGIAAVAGAFVASALVSALVRQPMQGALGGMILLAVLFGVAVLLAAKFPFATVGGRVPLAPLAVLPLVLALPLAAWFAACRGEPAGRGRIRRAAVVLAVAAAVGTAAFAIAAPWTLRAGVTLERGWIVPAPEGSRALAYGGGYPARAIALFDLRTLERIAFVGTSLGAEAKWNRDGSAFAFVEEVSRWGASRRPTLVVRRGSDGGFLRSAPIPLGPDDETMIRSVLWCGERIVLEPWDGPPYAIAPGDAGFERIGSLGGDPATEVRLLGCAASGDLLALRADAAEMRAWTSRSGDRGQVPEATVVRLSWRERPGEVDEVAHVRMPLLRLGERLSPTGRFVMTQAREYGAEEIRILDLRDGREHVLDGVRLQRWGWMADERLVWAEDRGPAGPPRIRLWAPGDDPEEFAIPTRRGRDVSATVSPDGRRVLVRAWHEEASGADRGRVRVLDRAAVLDPRTGSWIDVVAPEELVDGTRGPGVGGWVGSDAVLVGDPGELRVVPVPG